MIIKQLEIVGFKSFVDKVSLQFPQGMNTIVGPNGCGKSNVFDAIRWVMGEPSAKSLRGGSMEDVIFKGSDTRKPIGMAEVSLILAVEEGQAPESYRNCSEIMVTRRLFRNGESEYYINKIRCRRLDIQELFMDSGMGAKSYAIIGQGNIEAVLNAKPEERRALIEEAAGVSKFKARRKAALRKIESTSQNLKRLEDVIGEIQRQLGSLKRQAAKAKRFREVREEMKRTEIAIGRCKYRELERFVEGVGETQKHEEERLESLSRQASQAESWLDELKAGQLEEEKSLEELRQRCFALSGEVQKLSERLEFNNRDQERIEQEETRIIRELETLQARNVDNRKNESNLQALLVALESQLAESGQSLEEEEEKLRVLQGSEREILAALTRHREELFRCLNELSRLSNQSEDSRQRLELVENRINRCAADMVRNRDLIAELEKKAREGEAALAHAREKEQQLNVDREALNTRKNVMSRALEQNDELSAVGRERVAGIRSRIESLAELDNQAFGEESPGRQLLLRGLQGMVADFLDVPPELDKAFEAALGKRLQGLLVSKDQDFLSIFESARETSTDNYTLVLPFASFETGTFFSGGIPLLDLVPSRRDTPSHLVNLLHGVYLVESLDPFLGGKLPWGTTLVTGEGEVLSHRGVLSVSSGKRNEAGVLGRKREMRRLEKASKDMDADLSQLRFNRQTLHAEFAEAEKGLKEKEELLQKTALEQQGLRQAEAQMENELRQVRDRLEVLTLEQEQLQDERQSLEAALAEAVKGRQEKEQEKNRVEARVKILQDDLAELEGRLGQAREGVTGRKVELGQLRERRTGLQRSLDENRKALRESEDRHEQLLERRQEIGVERSRLGAGREELRTQLDILIPQGEKEQEQLDILKARQAEGRESIRSQEEALKSLRSQVGEKSEEITNLKFQLQEKKLAMEHLHRAFQERYQYDIRYETESAGHDFDLEASENRRLELQRYLDRIGEVNLTALEEYSALEERWEFLRSQKEDLEKSIADLETAIQKINQTTCRRFADAFEKINEQFKKVLPRLFCGGKGELCLTDEKNLLETGIEVTVQPPGKKLQGLDLLSGGEKALTAIALIFSTFMVRPSPFCLMDEVDAPLDDANTDRFNSLIKELAKKSQFIIITHNKRTMEVCDTLYGVTMEESGVSKLVSVRLTDFK
ncbi:MAG: chromosome segregation protein SMC [Deltaproteobacteria bacterium]|nr:chromosome segregation protein SMC [Deltaproteobacteria bacterium]